jgi:hypothetical protein
VAFCENNLNCYEKNNSWYGARGEKIFWLIKAIPYGFSTVPKKIGLGISPAA